MLQFADNIALLGTYMHPLPSPRTDRRRSHSACCAIMMRNACAHIGANYEACCVIAARRCLVTLPSHLRA